MRLRLDSVVLGLSTFLLMPAAHAGIIDFTLSGEDSASIAIVVSGGIATSITGTFDSSTILSLLPVDSIGGNDNMYTGTSPYFDNSGLSFSLATPDSYGYSYINLSNATNLPFYAFGTCQGNSPSSSVPCDGDPPGAPFTGDSITIVGTPEPSGLILLGAGLVVLVGAARFRLFA